MAVLARTHRDLAGVRALAEREGIPVRWWADRGKLPPLHQVREIRGFLRQLQDQRGTSSRATDLCGWVEPGADRASSNPWVRFLQQMLEAW